MIPHRLLAPSPGWVRRADVVVVGSGVAGLTAVLAVRRAMRAGRVLLVTKSLLDAGSTRWAQGGVAAALGPDDSPAGHLRDTLEAGAGLCDEAAVRALVTEGPDAVRRLIGLGARFDLDAADSVALTREGGHRRRRIAHAGGDATGAEISRALLAALKAPAPGPRIEIIEHALVLDLLRTADGRVAGITLHVMGEGQPDGVGAIHASAVVLATGGLGQVYSATTNPEVSTGDGVALALRAGAQVCDLEFVQFHPTVLWLGPDARGRQPLISEAVRGEGAFLVDGAGRRFMDGRHPLADLAPRDIVAKAIMATMLAAGTDHVYLDGRHLGLATWEQRFPTILENCRSHGIDPVRELIPVVPAAHYASGGIWTGLRGRTSVPGLYACGEAACTGVHGANRLASNSLLEGLVFAERIGADLADAHSRQASCRQAPDQVSSRQAAAQQTQSQQVLSSHAGLPLATAAFGGGASANDTAAGLLDPSIVPRLRAIMSEQAGVLRSVTGLRAAAAELGRIGTLTSTLPCTEAWEATNLHLVASALVKAAATRQESRGSHWREDFPDLAEEWRGHLITTLTADGLATIFEPLEPGSPPSSRSA
jgi:L-aspartate oxidase